MVLLGIAVRDIAHLPRRGVAPIGTTWNCNARPGTCFDVAPSGATWPCAARRGALASMRFGAVWRKMALSDVSASLSGDVGGMALHVVSFRALVGLLVCNLD